jgi:hypothetical protein
MVVSIRPDKGVRIKAKGKWQKPALSTTGRSVLVRMNV